ncbi:serine/threonine protein kinase (plasmid) [Halomicrobium sp. IBSBa]|uniref:serine/threonine-protein kinase n=1 Tax=Halomicrobium sp. IBSBa TaxID=2778916 RepID=UPI001ABF2187|nr:serine/threonine-protein kinase [Halomicrobium sp. IBSBa]MBO4249028.1 serine/threonine protein kinase [Halomicrobium sp. IBSBa]
MTDDEPPRFVTTTEQFSTDFGTTTVESEPVLVHSLAGEGGQAVVGVYSTEIHEGECHLAVGIDETVSRKTAEPQNSDTAANDEPDAAATVARPAEKVPEPVEPPLPESVTYSELTIGERVGDGGFAEVRAATVESSPDAELAVKRLSDEGTLARATIDQFVEAAKLWGQCDDHPHVVSVVDWGKVPRPWIAMERLTGGDLRQRLQTADDGLAIDEGLWIASVLAETLADVHHLGVRHFDLRAQNVLFAPTPEGVWDLPKIGDWGVAKTQRSGDDPAALDPRYAAPEQFESDRELDHRTDIYQLGAVLYELLTGAVPTATGAEGESVAERSLPTPPSELRPELPSSVDEVVQTALAPAPSERYSRAIYLADALDDLVDDTP